MRAFALEEHDPAVDGDTEVQVLVDASLAANELEREAEAILVTRQNRVGTAALEHRHLVAKTLDLVAVADALANQPDVDGQKRAERDRHRHQDPGVRPSKLSPSGTPAILQRRGRRWFQARLA